MTWCNKVSTKHIDDMRHQHEPPKMDLPRTSGASAECCGGKWCGVRTNASSAFPVLFGNDWSIAIFSWPARGWTDVGKVVQMRLSTALKVCTCHAEFLNFSGEIILFGWVNAHDFCSLWGKILNAVRKEPCGVLSTQWAAEHLGASDHRISHLHVLPRLGRKCGAESFFGSIFSKNEFDLQVKRVFFFPFIFLWLLRWPKY